MFSFFKIFKKRKEKKSIMAKKFEIEVFDEDLLDNGKIYLKPAGRQTVEANTPQELVSLFKMCGQQIKILREINDELSVAQSQISSSQSISSQVQPVLNIKPEIELSATQISQPVTQQQIGNSKIEFYKVGDIEIKSENGILYEKRWITVTSEENENIRIISDKTNKVVSLIDKHIEIKKWVKLNDTDNLNKTDINLD